MLQTEAFNWIQPKRLAGWFLLQKHTFYWLKHSPAATLCSCVVTYLVSQPRPEQMMNSKLVRETFYSQQRARALLTSLLWQHGETAKTSRTQTCLSSWHSKTSCFVQFQTSIFVNAVIYWVNIWTFAKTCETKILGCKNKIQRCICKSNTFFPFVYGFV